MKAQDALVLSDRGPLLLHAHANGYPPEVYRSFLSHFLDTYQTRAIYLRPFWPGSEPESLRDWRLLRDDYLADLPVQLKETGSETLVGMGHSLGGMTTLMAAIEEPERFRALVLIDPTLFSLWKGFLFRCAAPFKLFRYFHPLGRRTLRRKTAFRDLESMFQNYRTKKIFAAFPDDVLWDYVRGLAYPQKDGSLGLKYSPEWEIQIYETVGTAERYAWSNLSRISCPVLVLRGGNSDTLDGKTLERMTRRMPNCQAVTVPSVGHLLPMEEPERVAEIILAFLEKVK